MIVITRVGGEGADLPDDMLSVVDGSYASRAEYVQLGAAGQGQDTVLILQQHNALLRHLGHQSGGLGSSPNRVKEEEYQNVSYQHG